MRWLGPIGAAVVLAGLLLLDVSSPNWNGLMFGGLVGLSVGWYLIGNATRRRDRRPAQPEPARRQDSLHQASELGLSRPMGGIQFHAHRRGEPCTQECGEL